MKRCLWIAVALFFIGTLGACGENSTVCERTVVQMDTVMTFRLYAEQEAGDVLLEECERILRTLDGALSRTVSGSDIARINQAAAGEAVPVGRDTIQVLMIAERMRAISDGAFHYAIEPVSALWRRCEAENVLPTVEECNAALQIVHSSVFEIEEECGVVCKQYEDSAVDLGGIGKGYAIDQLLSFLGGKEIDGALITFGSNVAVLGKKPDGTVFRVAIRDPDTDGTIGMLRMTEEGGVLSVSGHYERYYTIGGEQFSHILDPKTGMPPENELQSVIVLCGSGAVADALSTALLVMGEEAGISLWRLGEIDFEAIFIREDGITLTEGLQGCFEASVAAGNVTVAYLETVSD